MGEQTVRCKAVCGKMKPDELGGPRGRLAEKVAPSKDLKGERGPWVARRASAKAPGETRRECPREGWRGCVRAEVGVGGERTSGLEGPCTSVPLCLPARSRRRRPGGFVPEVACDLGRLRL